MLLTLDWYCSLEQGSRYLSMAQKVTPIMYLPPNCDNFCTQRCCQAQGCSELDHSYKMSKTRMCIPFVIKSSCSMLHYNKRRTQAFFRAGSTSTCIGRVCSMRFESACMILTVCAWPSHAEIHSVTSSACDFMRLSTRPGTTEDSAAFPCGISCKPKASGTTENKPLLVWIWRFCAVGATMPDGARSVCPVLLHISCIKKHVRWLHEPALRCHATELSMMHSSGRPHSVKQAIQPTHAAGMRQCSRLFRRRQGHA